MAYRLLGSSTTDSDGQAVYQYTGVGAGEIDIIASLDNPITSGSLQSGTYPIWDYIVYDGGVTGDKSSTWTVTDSEITTDNEGTLIDKKGNYKSTILISGDFQATFEATNNGAFRFGVRTANDNEAVLYIGNYSYYRMKRENGVFTFEVSNNGTSWTTKTGDTTTVTTEDVYFIFYVLDNSRSLKYKNLRILPL